MDTFESNTFCCGNLQNALRVKAPRTSALISAFKNQNEVGDGAHFVAGLCKNVFSSMKNAPIPAVPPNRLI